jgi:substrate import-associated zinc metallohydrolase lipoprotein
MKHRIFYFVCILISAGAFVSCEEAVLTNSVVAIPDGPQTELDRWIDETFRVPYNIQVQYQWYMADMDPSHVLVPPKEELIQPFLKAVLKIWMKPYLRVAKTGEDFMKDYTARQLILVGSGSWNSDGSVTLGQATNGYRITLYTVNDFDLAANKVSREDLLLFFRTMHHEFGHILNQRKPYDPNFQNITGNYTADWTLLTHAPARELGFISNYARSADIEDFVEVLSYYITSTPGEWDALINSIKSVQGREYITAKVQTVRMYMKNSYEVDIEKLREEIIAAVIDVANGNLD